MAGLLDFLNAPDAQVGLGLLAAGGPRADGAGFGQRLQEGLGAADAWKQRQQALAMQKMQMDNYASEIEQRKAAVAAQAQKQALIASIFGGSDAGAAQGVSTQSVGLPSNTVTAGGGIGGGQQNQRARGIGGLDINDVTRLKMNGIDVMNEFKWANDPLKLEQGSTYRDRVSGTERFMPKVGEGIAPGAGGMYGALPGYAGAQADIEGAKAGAVERAKAGLDLVAVPMGNGQTQMVPRAQAVQMLGGGQAQGGPAGYANESQMRNTAAGDMGADPKALQREISAVKADLLKPLDQASKTALQSHLDDLVGQAQKIGAPVAAASQFGVTQSEADKARAVKTAEADVVRDTTKQTNAKMYGQMREGVSRAIDLLNQGPTASGAGSLADTAAGFFGQSTKGADTASKLDTLSGWLTANVPRMEGPQSDRDVMNYRVMAGTVGDKTKPVSQRLAAANELKTLQDKYAELNGYSDGKTSEQKAPDLMPSLPTANASNKGRKIRDTETGKILVSNGLSWTEAK